jgi:hypothetical protein
MSEHSGEYGGVVKREIKNAGGKKYIVGAVLTPEEVANWPLANRIALHQSGYIDWYGPPASAETAARASGSPARPRRTVAAPVKQPDVVKSRRGR